MSRIFPFLRKKQAPFERAWDFLSSNVLAVILLVVLALISVFGTLVPQKESPQVYLKLYGEVFAGLFSFLGLTNLYFSPLFIFVLILLGASLSACSLKRLDKAIKKKTDYRLWGSFLAHISLLIIYVGAIYGSLSGFSANISIVKGESYFEPRGGFSVRLNDFNAKFDAQGRPLRYTSDLSVMEGSKEVQRKTIFVNSPLTHREIKFYQSSYGLTGLLEISGPGGKTERIPISKGSCAVYSATGQMFCVEQFFPDIHSLHGMASEVFEPEMPVVFLTTQADRQVHEVGWLVKGKPLRWEKYAFSLIGAREFTGLQVKRDPGVPLVYLGFLFLTAGIGVMLYGKRGN